jgi:hypothetical protein
MQFNLEHPRLYLLYTHFHLLPPQKQLSNPPIQNIKERKQKGRSPNIVLAKCGIKCIIELFYIYIRKKLFLFTIFYKLAKRKKFLLRVVFP